MYRLLDFFTGTVSIDSVNFLQKKKKEKNRKKDKVTVTIIIEGRK